MKIKGIKYISPAFDGSGYGQASRGYIMALHELGIPVTLSPISFEKKSPNLGKYGRTLRSLVGRPLDYNVVVIHTIPEFWAEHREKDKINIGYTVWETTKLHPTWPNYINDSVRKVLVSCEWNKNVFKDSGVEVPIGVVPHGIDANEFDGVEPYEIAGIGKDTFVFYDIFQWSERKHPTALIKAYWHAFQNDEDVALVLKTYRGDYSEQEKKAIRDHITLLKKMVLMEKRPKIYLISDMLSRDEILGLHKRGNCFVSLDRGEGFGLPGFEAGACGNPIIITGFGGATEYAKEDNSYLVDYTLTPVFGIYWSRLYLGTQLWAEPDVYGAAWQMRHVYSHQDEAVNMGYNLQQNIKENFSWEKVGQKMIDEIETL